MKKILSIFIFALLLFSEEMLGQSAFSHQEQKVSVYPNPAKDFLYIKSANPNIKIKSVAFYSILGSVVSEININANYSEIKVDKMKSGKYLMRYTLSDNSQKTISIIKQ